MSIKRHTRCDYKVCYLDVRKAIGAADRYMDRIVLTRLPMWPYYCSPHSCWHIGHDRTKITSHTFDYQMRCVYRQRLRRQIQGLNGVLLRIDIELKQVE